MPTDEPRAELFRPAAVAAHRAGRGTLAELPSSRRVTTGAFWAVAVAVSLLVVIAFGVHVDETSVGAWRAGPGTGATVALPIGVLDRVRAGEIVVLRTPGLPGVTAAITTVLNPVPAAEAEAQFGSALPATLRAASAVALVEVRLSQPMSSAQGGRATLHLGRRSLVAELVPALRHDG